jgi:beta-glucanase (GH16 family)
MAGTGGPVSQPSGAVTAAPSGRPSAPDLIASDDFSGTALASRWDVYESTAPNGSAMSPDNVRIVDGELRIVGSGRNPTGKGNLTGGLCWCKAQGNRTYGKWEVRAKFEAAAGYGPVIGLWPQSGNPKDGWITFVDAQEASRHTLRGNVSSAPGATSSGEHSLSGDFTDWHTYTVVWRETYVKMYVDGKLFYDSTERGQQVAVPQVPLHLYLQQTAGPADSVGPADAGTPDEVTMHIDWVKLYR